MVRTKDEALAAVERALEESAAVVSTSLDKLIDANFTGSNSVSFDHVTMANAAIRTELEEDYEAGGWTVVFTDLGGGVWRITVS